MRCSAWHQDRVPRTNVTNRPTRTSPRITGACIGSPSREDAVRRRSFITIAAVAAVALLLSAAAQPSATPDPQPFTLTAAGDYSASANAGATLDAIRASGAALNLAVGDMSYGVTGQEQAWCDFVTSHIGVAFP